MRAVFALFSLAGAIICLIFSLIGLYREETFLECQKLTLKVILFVFGTMLGSFCFFGYIYYPQISKTCILAPTLNQVVGHSSNVGAVIMLFATAFFTFILVLVQALMSIVLYAQQELPRRGSLINLYVLCLIKVFLCCQRRRARRQEE